jgi:ABC-2 type transport system permease protein
MRTPTYLSLQLKRSFKLLPVVLVIVTITLCLIGAAGFSFLSADDESDALLNVGITGNIKGTYIEAGIELLKTADGSRFFANFIEIPDEKEALRLVYEGKLHGYLSIPDGYFEDIYHGVNTPATYVTLGNATGISADLLAEVTKTVAGYVTETQNGIYCMQDTVHSYKLDTSTRPYTTRLNVEYIKEILGRYASFKAETLTLPDSVSLIEYYVCAIVVILFLLWGIACHRLLDTDSLSMSKLLSSRGLSHTRQVLCEYGAFLAVTYVTVLLFSLIIGVVSQLTGIIPGVGIFAMLIFSIKLIPVIVMITFMQFCLYELLGSGVGSLTVHFLLVIAMCYISGCFYPNYIFPRIIRDFGALLPAGVGFTYLRQMLNGNVSIPTCLSLLGYTLIFALICVLSRKKRAGN